MKISGKKIERPAFEVCVIPRSTGDIVFKAAAVLDFTIFNNLCPAPVPPTVIKPGSDSGIKSVNPEDPKYKLKQQEWASHRVSWMIKESLKVTDGLEFETIKEDEPESWGNVFKELESAGFSVVEVNSIVETVMIACGFTQEKITEATKNFLVSLAAPKAI